MKFVRFGAQGNETPGVQWDEETILDISSIVDDIGPDTVGSLKTIVERVGDGAGLPSLAVAGVRLGAPISRPHKIIGVGLNYAEHIAEAGVETPTEPVVFMKATSSLSGPCDDIVFPPGFDKVDWEVELALVIGTAARSLAGEEEAMGHIAGYALAHDVSERAFQLERGGQWMKGKSADTFSPLGPWLVTPDEIPNVGDLELKCWVNGELRQSGSTSTMIFSPGHIVWYLSQFMTIEPGDVVLTGTPKGVGLATGNYLEPGDRLQLEIPGLGVQRQTCRRA
ncbi:MAG: fumarylacetoacetate hydrolase family protein [Acidimicrobiia bacterium]|nr:fumarylacetoacetate hydrolase family protein [Acidimicrobiia bacterium]